MSMSNDWPSVIAFGVCVCACFTDLRARTIPNWLSLGLLLAGSVGHLLQAGFSALASAVLSALVCGALPYFLFRRNALGGGDVKLFAALGATLGTARGLELELLSFALLAAFALLDAFVRGRLWHFLGGSVRASFALVRSVPLVPEQAGHELPMGGAILLAFATLVVRGWLS